MTTLIKITLLQWGLMLVGIGQGHGYGFDSAASCGPANLMQSRKGRSQLLRTIPCDLAKHGYCAQPGSEYPWHAVRRFVHENQGLMKRMYGDIKHISVLRDELMTNELDISDMELAIERYTDSHFSHRVPRIMVKPLSQQESGDFAPKAPHFRPIITSTSAAISTEDSSTKPVTGTNAPHHGEEEESTEPFLLDKERETATDIYSNEKFTDKISISEKDDSNVELVIHTVDQNESVNVAANSVYETVDEEDHRFNKHFYEEGGFNDGKNDEMHSRSRESSATESTTSVSDSSRTESSTTISTKSTTPLLPSSKNPSPMSSTTNSDTANSGPNKSAQKQRRPFVPSPMHRQRPNPFNFYRQNATISAKLKLKLNPSDSSNTFPTRHNNNNTLSTQKLQLLNSTKSSTLSTMMATAAPPSSPPSTIDSIATPATKLLNTPPKFNKIYNRHAGDTYSQVHRFGVVSSSGSLPTMVVNTSVISNSNFMLMGEKPPVQRPRLTTTVRTTLQRQEDSSTTTTTTPTTSTSTSSPTTTQSLPPASSTPGSTTPVKVSSTASTTTTSDSQLFQDTVRQEQPPIMNVRGVNACPVKEEVVAPFWANNTRGEVLALLNLYPFEQYVHWEKCTHEHKQMHCREGCRCEQQYRLHRLLAYDPHNECRGIFSDWFRFPSCCVCKCYNIPFDFRTTARSPRSYGGDAVAAAMESDQRHPLEMAEEQVRNAIYEHATDEWYHRPTKDDYVDDIAMD